MSMSCVDSIDLTMVAHATINPAYAPGAHCELYTVEILYFQQWGIIKFQPNGKSLIVWSHMMCHWNLIGNTEGKLFINTPTQSDICMFVSGNTGVLEIQWIQGI